jgi:hypothetical protein
MFVMARPPKILGLGGRAAAAGQTKTIFLIRPAIKQFVAAHMETARIAPGRSEMRVLARD